MTAASTPDSDDAPRELMGLIDAAGCARLLAAVDVGRLAVVIDGRPRIIVLNYAYLDGDLFFRTRHDATLARLTADGATLPAEFEVDSSFPVAESGWSVIAGGTLEGEAASDRATAALARIRPWAQGERETLLRLRVADLTGRRVGSL